MRSGIADYARAYKAAIEPDDWRLDVNDLGRGSAIAARPGATRGGSRGGAATAGWRTWPRPRQIGFKQHDEFGRSSGCGGGAGGPLLRDGPRSPWSSAGPPPPGLRRSSRRRAPRLRMLDYTPLGRSVWFVLRGPPAFSSSRGGCQVLRGVVGDPRRVGRCPFSPTVARNGAAGGGTAGPPKVSSGFWGPGKGIEVLLRRSSGSVGAPALRLVLAGGSRKGERTAVVESVRERIRRSPGRNAIDEIGYVPAETLDGVFAAADVFVQPAVRMAASRQQRALPAWRPARRRGQRPGHLPGRGAAPGDRPAGAPRDAGALATAFCR